MSSCVRRRCVGCRVRLAASAHASSTIAAHCSRGPAAARRLRRGAASGCAVTGVGEEVLRLPGSRRGAGRAAGAVKGGPAHPKSLAVPGGSLGHADAALAMNNTVSRFSGLLHGLRHHRSHDVDRYALPSGRERICGLTWPPCGARAQAAGVGHCVLPAVAAGNFETVRALAHRFGDSYALGIHPLCTGSARDEDLVALDRALAAHRDDPRLVAVGEIGLDYFVPGLDAATAGALLSRATGARTQARPAGPAARAALGRRRSSSTCAAAVVAGIAHAFNGSAQQAGEFVGLRLQVGLRRHRHVRATLQIRRLATRVVAVRAGVGDRCARHPAALALRDGRTTCGRRATRAQRTGRAAAHRRRAGRPARHDARGPGRGDPRQCMCRAATLGRVADQGLNRLWSASDQVMLRAFCSIQDSCEPSSASPSCKRMICAPACVSITCSAVARIDGGDQFRRHQRTVGAGVQQGPQLLLETPAGRADLVLQGRAQGGALLAELLAHEMHRAGVAAQAVHRLHALCMACARRASSSIAREASSEVDARRRVTRSWSISASQRAAWRTRFCSGPRFQREVDPDQARHRRLGAVPLREGGAQVAQGRGGQPISASAWRTNSAAVWPLRLPRKSSAVVLGVQTCARHPRRARGACRPGRARAGRAPLPAAARACGPWNRALHEHRPPRAAAGRRCSRLDGRVKRCSWNGAGRVDSQKSWLAGSSIPPRRTPLGSRSWADTDEDEHGNIL